MPPPVAHRPTSDVKARDLYGENHSFSTRPEDKCDAPVFGTASQGRFSPGYRQRQVTDHKKRDLAGSGLIWFTDPKSGSAETEPVRRPARGKAGKTAGGGAVQVKLG